MQIDKIKIKADDVYIEWSEKSTGGTNIFTLDCKQRAQPELYQKMVQLADHVVELIEVPDTYVQGMEIRGVSFDWTEMDKKSTVMGAVITVVKRLKSGLYLCFNTPHATEIPFGKSTELDRCLSSACCDVLRELITEAKGYIAGKRAQLALFENEAESSAPRKVHATAK